MKLPLLQSTSDVPSRIPVTRSPAAPRPLAAESDLAIRPVGLPQGIPPPLFLPSDYGSAPMEALTRLGATGAQVVAQTGEVFLQAEVRRREADAAAQGERLYQSGARLMDGALAKLEVEATHETLRPGYYAAWEGMLQETMDQAQGNPAVQSYLAKKFDGLRTMTQREVNTIWRNKYRNFHEATFEQNVDDATTLATNATPDALAFHLNNLENVFELEAKKGIVPPDTVLKRREKALTEVRMDRAETQVYLAPLTMLEKIAKGDPALQGYSTKEVRTLAEKAEQRIRQIRADDDHARVAEERETAAKQNDLAITWRQRITENYQPGGLGVDQLAAINGDARNLGETNHAQLTELHRAYRERHTNPKVASVRSNPETVGRYQHAILTGKFDQVSQDDLLRSFRGTDLDESDYKHLSGLLDTKLRQRAEDAKQPKTEASEFQKQQIKDAEKTIDEFLKRGSRFQGDPKSVATDILVRDAQNELHMRLAKDPSLNPMEVADDLIANRMTAVESIARGLPYKNAAEVLAAYQAKLIDKATATRYAKIFRALHDRPPKSSGEAAGDDGGSTRKPVKP